MYEVEISDYKILLVDDDVAYSRIKQIFFEDNGFTISVINNPEEALKYIQNNKVDLILLDYFMPEMTGERFLQELRKFDAETVVILQTGYSGEKPQNEMLYSLNIQGYYNKEKDNDDLMLMVISAIKSVKLLREIKQREEEKQIKKLKDEFFADKINTISCEINEKLMSIGGPTMVLEDWTKENIPEEEKQEFITKRLTYIKDATGKIRETMKALNIASEKEIVPQSMIQKINELLEIEMSVKGAKLDIEASEDFAIINTEEGTVPYLICKDIENRINAGSKNIKITSQKAGANIVIKMISEVEIPNDEKAELEKVASFCEFAKLNISDAETELIIEKIKK